jgi:sugar lactone lactonase YvrE
VNAVLLWDCRCRLGEGAVWSAADASLYFVDVQGRELLAFTPATGAQRRWPMPQRIGWIVPRASGGWIVGLQSGVAALRLEPEPRFEWLHRLHPEGSPMRLNDAKVDATGRLWFGSLNNDDESRPDGRLYRWSAGKAPVEADAGYCVTNGPTFSADGRTLFHTDSVRATVYAYDLSGDGAIANRREWLRFAADEGYPDGMTTDAAGHVWIAHWGGARVTQRDGAGRVLRQIDLPVPHVTTVAFGGADFTDLFVTSARAGLDAAALERAPRSGSLFVVHGAGPGRPPNAFSG